SHAPETARPPLAGHGPELAGAPQASPADVTPVGYQVPDPGPVPNPGQALDQGQASDPGQASDLGQGPDPGQAPVPGQPEEIPAPERAEATSGTLELEQVIDSVTRAYPLLQVALRDRQIADGKQLAAWGEFDLGVKAFSIAEPMGYYQTYRNGLALEQPTFQGGYLYGGYKLGRGSFQPWFKERQSNDGGEFAVGFGMPLLKNREIDERRAQLFDAELAREGVEPAIRGQLLDFVRLASQVYWTWVASGQVLEAQEELLRLAQARVQQIEQRVEAGDLPRITRINNDQLIAARETKVIEASRKLQMAAIKLSLFWRADGQQPIVPDTSQLPAGFPPLSPPAADQVQRDIDAALAARPELVELELLAERTRVELAKAENSLLPKLDVVLLASKDVGARATKTGDKTPFELEAGLVGDVPVQRREARGKITAARGKLAQLDAKRQFVADKITAEVRDVVSELIAAHGRAEQAGINLRLARQTLDLGREQFNVGDIDLISLNIYEQAVTDAQFLLIAAQADYFIALADYRAALAMQPRD
ncbi:MAG: TolC family protein, partial [Pirellulaceae bacterium]|nr:TolC family protein [Pirellulaceae bacterium]